VLLSCECFVAGAALLRAVARADLFPSVEDCVRGATDWTKAEEIIFAMPQERVATLVFLGKKNN
jgi:hypothetical protein